MIFNKKKFNCINLTAFCFSNSKVAPTGETQSISDPTKKNQQKLVKVKFKKQIKMITHI